MNKRRLILFVDDDPTRQRAIKPELKKRGWIVVTVPDGKTAVEVAKSVVLDLILINMTQPEKDSFDAAKQLKELHKSFGKDVPIVAITASAVNRHPENYPTKMDDYISEPVTPDALYSVIQKYLMQDYLGRVN